MYREKHSRYGRVCMAINANIERIVRLPEFDTELFPGDRRQRQMAVEVFIKPAAWGLHLPETYLSDDRLPAAYTPFPQLPYPTTDTTTPAAFVPFDTGVLLYGVEIRQTNTLSSIVFVYKYYTNPPVIPGTLPQDLRRNPASSPPARSDLGFDYSLTTELLEEIYTHDGSADSRCYLPPPDPDPNAPPPEVDPGEPPPPQLTSLKVLNTAGDRYEKQPTRELTIVVLRIMRKERYFRPNYWRTWDRVLNSRTWNDRPPGTVLCKEPQMVGIEAFGDGIVYKVNYEFRWLDVTNQPAGMQPELDPETFWLDRILSYGLQEKQADGTLKPIRIPLGGADTRVAMPLDADGKAIRPPGSSPAALSVYRKRIYVDFAPLNIVLPQEEVPPSPEGGE
jgi:hypothetical protein